MPPWGVLLAADMVNNTGRGKQTCLPAPTCLCGLSTNDTPLEAATQPHSGLQGSQHTPNRDPCAALRGMYTKTFCEQRHTVLLKCPAGKAGKRKSTPTRT